MTAFLSIIIVLFIAIAIWQMVKIFDLAQVGVSNNQVANDNDNRLNGYLMIGFLIFIYVITIVCMVKWGDLPLMSNSASEHGPGIDNLMIISMVIIFIVQTVTQYLLHYFAFKYRGEEGKKKMKRLCGSSSAPCSLSPFYVQLCFVLPPPPPPPPTLRYGRTT